MPNYYVDSEGYIVDEDGDYVLDEDGDLITEAELNEAGDDSDFVDAMTESYHKLRSTLGREPTDRELTSLLADAEQTGDPYIADSYERVTGRPADPSSLRDDNTRIELMAEYATGTETEDSDGDE